VDRYVYTIGANIGNFGTCMGLENKVLCGHEGDTREDQNNDDERKQITFGRGVPIVSLD